MGDDSTGGTPARVVATARAGTPARLPWRMAVGLPAAVGAAAGAVFGWLVPTIARMISR